MVTSLSVTVPVRFLARNKMPIESQECRKGIFGGTATSIFIDMKSHELDMWHIASLDTCLQKRLSTKLHHGKLQHTYTIYIPRSAARWLQSRILVVIFQLGTKKETSKA